MSAASLLRALADNPAALAALAVVVAESVALAIGYAANDPQAALALPGVVLDRAAAVVRVLVDEVRVQWAGVAAWVSPPAHGAHEAHRRVVTL